MLYTQSNLNTAGAQFRSRLPTAVELSTVGALLGFPGARVYTYCTVRILEQNIVLGIVTLGLHLIPGPTDGRHELISAHDLTFCRTASVELMLGGTHDGKSTS
jgi:hypothetical protein